MLRAIKIRLCPNKTNEIKVGVRSTEFTLVDYPTMDDRSVMNLKSSDRLKQEIDNEQICSSFNRLQLFILECQQITSLKPQFSQFSSLSSMTLYFAPFKKKISSI